MYQQVCSLQFFFSYSQLDVFGRVDIIGREGVLLLACFYSAGKLNLKFSNSVCDFLFENRIFRIPLSLILFQSVLLQCFPTDSPIDPD